MKLKIYSIRDAKVECFNNPFFARTHGEATRMFINSADNGNFAKHHADYQLFYVGEFDDQSSVIESVTPFLIMTGTEARDAAIADL